MQLISQYKPFQDFVKQKTAMSTPETLLSYPQSQILSSSTQQQNIPSQISPTYPMMDQRPATQQQPELISQLKNLVMPQPAQAQTFGIWGDTDPLTPESRARARGMNRRGYVYPQGEGIETYPPKFSNILNIVKDAIQPRQDIPEELRVGNIWRAPDGEYQIKLSRIYSIAPWVMDDLFEKQAENNWLQTVWYDPRQQMYHYGGFKGKEGFDYAINTLGLMPVEVRIPGNLPPQKPELRGPEDFGKPPAFNTTAPGYYPPTRPQEAIFPPYQPTESIVPQQQGSIKQYFAQLRDMIIPAAQAATPEEVEEVRQNIATGTKVYNLSKAKQMNSRDILAAITKIEKKAQQFYPNQTDSDKRSRAIFMALGMNKQLGNQSPFIEWEKRMK